ncbi:MAG: glycosyltransferase family 4 protein [Chloroflexi bacterium]|nr:glycosyltransferase family 4 protein [Chloroflexota bacterium]
MTVDRDRLDPTTAPQADEAPGRAPLHLTFVTQRYWPATGGIEVHLHSLATGLARRHRVRVITQLRDDRPPSVANTSYRAPRFSPYQDGTVEVMPLVPSGLDRLMLLPLALRHTPVLSRYCYQDLAALGVPFFERVFHRRLVERLAGSDLVHMFGAQYAGIAAERAARHLGLPFVITPFVHPGWWGDDRMNLELYRRAAAVVALTEEEKRFYVRNGVGAERVHVIGVAPSIATAFDAEGFRSRHGLSGPIVLFVGRKEAYKGYRALLQAAPLVWERAPAAHVVLMGPRLEACEDPALKDRRVLDLDRVDDVEKTSALAAADILCLPSASESFGVVFLEAWSLGRPVIGGNIPTTRELVDDGRDGLLTDRTPEGVAAAILRLLEDPDLRRRLGEAGRRKVAERYAPEVILARSERLYYSVLGGLT